MIDLPDIAYEVRFMYLWGDRLYYEANNTLYVISVGNLTIPLATYPLGNSCESALITVNRLYLGGTCKLHIFEVTTSLTEPLTSVAKIPTKWSVSKILRVGDDLLLG